MAGQNEVPRRTVLAAAALAPAAFAVGAAHAQTSGKKPVSNGRVALVTGSSRASARICALEEGDGTAMAVAGISSDAFYVRWEPFRPDQDPTRDSPPG